MIDQLIAALNQEVELSAEEIADTLWLAMQMEQSGVDSTSRQSSNSQPDQETTEDNSQQHSPADLADQSATETPTTEIESREKKPTSDLTGVYNQKPDQNQKSLDIPFKVPDAPSLREQLNLARALRPLMRRIPSGSSLVLDEAATTQRIANEGIWLPVIKPTLEPWLDLELVVDEGISMQIWRQTIKELERLLKNYGIFRDVRVWGLISNEQNKIQIRRGIGATAKNQSPRSTAELIDSSGRRLVLVVSDCVSDLWRSGAVNLALKTWANNVPTAIIQMLPQWLWGRTALGRASEVKLQGLAPSVSNRQLIANTVSLWSEIDPATGIKVPVFTLEPERVAKWAQMLVGKGSIRSSGFVFKPEIRNLEQEKPLFNLERGELTPKQRVQAFRVTASPMARKLAGLLASAPVISLPVVRLIRETMLPESQQVHVAEVFLGGLLKPLSEIEVDTNPNYVQYGFIDGVRELLVDSVPTSSVLNVVEEVSEFIAKKIGKSLNDFLALLKNPQELKNSEFSEKLLPFAMVTAQILRSLGGEYTKAADKIQPKSEVATVQDENYISHVSDEDLKIVDKTPLKEEGIITQRENSENYMSKKDKQIRILHLSDIHLGTLDQAKNYFVQLAADLTQNLKVQQINYLVLSGDIANRSTAKEYDAAYYLVKRLIDRYKISSERIIIVPGNHDLNWDLSEEAYDFVSKRKRPESLIAGQYIDAGGAGALIRDEEKYQKRFKHFSDFYRKIYGKTYPLEYDRQAIIHICHADKILFLTLNSCWELDHHYKNRASINPNAISHAVDRILDNYDNWLKIAVWHHPVTSAESMKNVAFLEQLAVNSFQIAMHGHIHEAKNEFFKYDVNRGLNIIAAGTFGAPANQQVTSIPLQYNLLVLNPDNGELTVETRKKQKVDGAWSADARWGDQNNPVPRYVIPLEYNPKFMSTYNVVLVGQTGVGKSSVINYLYGSDEADVGIGKPVTKRGFFQYDFFINQLPVSLFDSWGLEVGKDREWMKKLDGELKNRGVDKPAQEWFHSVFYCISSASHRVQDYDLEIIRKFIKEKYKVIILLTKADFLEQDEDDLIKLENSIKQSLNKSVPIVRVSTKRGKYYKEGKNLIEAYSYYVFWNSIKLRLPSRCKRVVKDNVEQWKKDTISRVSDDLEEIIQDKMIPFFAISDVIKYLSNLDDYLEKNIVNYAKELTRSNGTGRNMIDNEIRQTLEIFGDFAKELKYPPDNMDEILGYDISNQIVPIRLKQDIEKYFVQVGEKFNARDFIGVLGTIIEAAINAASTHNFYWLEEEIINKRIEPALSETLDGYLNKLENQVEKIIEDISPDNPFDD